MTVPNHQLFQCSPDPDCEVCGGSGVGAIHGDEAEPCSCLHDAWWEKQIDELEEW